MNGMKIPMALIFAVILQAVGLVWYVSKIDSKEIDAIIVACATPDQIFPSKTTHSCKIYLMMLYLGLSK